jgi:hypothetical protein
VIVVVQVPVNKKIRFDETVNKLHALSIRAWKDRRDHRYNGDFDMYWDEYFDYETDVDYIMGKDGYLINTETQGKKENSDEKDKQSDTKRKTKDSVQKKSQTIKPESMDDVKEDEEANVKTSFYSPLSFASLFN